MKKPKPTMEKGTKVRQYRMDANMKNGTWMHGVVFQDAFGQTVAVKWEDGSLENEDIEFIEAE